MENLLSSLFRAGNSRRVPEGRRKELGRLVSREAFCLMELPAASVMVKGSALGAGMGLKLQFQPSLGEAAQVLGGNPVLKARQRRLGGQVGGILRGSVSHDLGGGLFGWGVCVIAVFIALGDGEQTQRIRVRRLGFALPESREPRRPSATFSVTLYH